MGASALSVAEADAADKYAEWGLSPRVVGGAVESRHEAMTVSFSERDMYSSSSSSSRNFHLHRSGRSVARSSAPAVVGDIDEPPSATSSWGTKAGPAAAPQAAAAASQAGADFAVAAASALQNWLVPGLVCLTDSASCGLTDCDDGMRRKQSARGAGGSFCEREGSALHCHTSAEGFAVEVIPVPSRSGTPDSIKPCAFLRSTAEHQVDCLVESSLRELFRLHDLNNDGVLEELELIKLNEKITMLHHGKDADMEVVRLKFKGLFRSCLDAEGRPVPYAIFRNYMRQVLIELDSDVRAQEMILEQFISEAKSGRHAFRCSSFQSTSDGQFLCELTDLSQFDEGALSEAVHLDPDSPKINPEIERWFKEASNTETRLVKL